jgi:L,D-peptidoglycan transpeptidase YkuD (ErfK/YbiS/YcfS/YnhG family)
MKGARAAVAVVAAAALIGCARHRASASASARANGSANAGASASASASARANGSANAGARTSPVPASARQLLIAVSADWNDPRVELARFERHAASDAWQPIGAPWRAVAGRAGLAWGRGLHGAGAPPGQSGPVKVEGDGRAPAGAFLLGPLYGYAPRAPANARLPYTQVTSAWRCVDDPSSRYYGQVIDRARVTPDWHSAEHMRLHDAVYRLVVVVESNPAPAVAGKGSCAFLHTWSSPSHGTSGCTAMPYPALERLTAWLAPGAVLIELPESELVALSGRWNLPRLAPSESERSE